MKPVIVINACFTTVLCLLFASGCSKHSSTDPSVAPLVITSLSVTEGPYNTLVTIKGSGFGTIISNDKIYFNGVPAIPSYLAENQINTAVPLAAGTGKVTVSVGTNTVTGPTFTYQQALVLTTLAGTHDQGYQDGTGTTALFQAPAGIALDKAGMIYVADHVANRIRKITQSGVVTTVAGSGEHGNADGQGIAATFFEPVALTVDNDGNIYVVDQANSLIRKITSTGLVITLAGNPYSRTQDGIGTAASFNRPTGIVIDASGNLLVSEHDGAIRKVTIEGVVTTLKLKQSITGADGIAIDKAGSLYISDQNGSNIFKISPSLDVKLIAFNSSISAITLQGAFGLAVDANGNVFVADELGNTITEVSANGSLSIFAGQYDGDDDGALNRNNFVTPRGIAIDVAGNFYITDYSRIRKISFQ